MNRMPSKIWYVVAGGLIVTAVSLGILGISQFLSTVENMHRVAMPGTAQIVLPPGPTTLYIERKSMIDGKAYEVPGEFDFRCGVTSLAGTVVPFETSRGNVTYETGDYAGRSAFDVRVDAGGTYVLACEAAKPFAMAVGRGVGTWIVVGLVGALVPGLLGLVTFILVLVLRHGHKRRIAAMARR